MLLPITKNRHWVSAEVQQRGDFAKSFKRIAEKITAPQFKDDLRGVYGYVDAQTFAKHQQAVLAMEHL